LAKANKTFFEIHSQKALEILHLLPQLDLAVMIVSRISKQFTATCASAVLMTGTLGADDAVLLEELRATISGIIEVQAQTSNETREWETRRAIMEDLLEIHRREIDLLNEELETSGRSAPGHAEAVAQAEQEIAALRSTRTQLIAAVENARPRVLALVPRFPRPLAAEVEPELITLENWKSGDEPREALQSLLGVISKATQFNRRISRSLEIVEDREVEVIYLGLARAFYADRSGLAGIGVPAADGWEWQADSALNRPVLRAFEILDQKRPPARIELPLHIE